MRYPKLVRPQMCKTLITVMPYSSDVDENGGPVAIASKVLMCNWQNSAKRVTDAQGRQVVLTGTAFFDGDIFPDQEIASGKVELYGDIHDIVTCYKGRNPDSTVNYTRLDVV